MLATFVWPRLVNCSPFTIHHSRERRTSEWDPQLTRGVYKPLRVWLTSCRWSGLYWARQGELSLTLKMCFQGFHVCVTSHKVNRSKLFSLRCSIIACPYIWQCVVRWANENRLIGNNRKHECVLSIRVHYRRRSPLVCLSFVQINQIFHIFSFVVHALFSCHDRKKSSLKLLYD